MPQNNNNRSRYNQRQVEPNNSDYVMPQATDIEKAVLGAQMIDKDANATFAKLTKNEPVYYDPRNQMIQDAIDVLARDGHPIDVWTVVNQLSSMGNLEEVGGPGYVMELSTKVASSSPIEYHTLVLLEKYTKRRLITNGITQQSKGFDNTISADELLSEVDTNLQSIFNILPNKEIKDSKAIIKEAVEEIQAAASNPDGITGIASFTSLDAKTAGFQNSDLIIVAARPAMGKTSFALTIIKKIAVIQKIPTAFFSLEMSKDQLINRLFAQEANVDAGKLRTGRLKDSEWDRLVHSADVIGKSNLMIDDTPGISIAELRSKCRRMKLEYGLDCIMIDYLQLMTAGGGRSSESRQQEISEISRSLKAIAREMEVPVVALSQLSRAVEQRPDHRPVLSDLRESGAIEQDADVVMFLYRDDYYNPESEKRGIAEVLIRKQRNGPIGNVELAWLAEYTKFASMMREPQQ